MLPRPNELRRLPQILYLVALTTRAVARQGVFGFGCGLHGPTQRANSVIVVTLCVSKKKLTQNCGRWRVHGWSRGRRNGDVPQARSHSVPSIRRCSLPTGCSTFTSQAYDATHEQTTCPTANGPTCCSLVHDAHVKPSLQFCHPSPTRRNGRLRVTGVTEATRDWRQVTGMTGAGQGSLGRDWM